MRKRIMRVSGMVKSFFIHAKCTITCLLPVPSIAIRFYSAGGTPSHRAQAASTSTSIKQRSWRHIKRLAHLACFFPTWCKLYAFDAWSLCHQDTKKAKKICKYMLTKYLYLILLKAIALHIKRSDSSLIHITPWPSNYVNKVANCVNPTFKTFLFCIIVNKLKYIKCIL